MSMRRGQKKAKLPPDDEFAELLAEHGSFNAVALKLGCTQTAVAYRCHKLGLESPNRRGGRRECAFCGLSSLDGRIERFTLVTGAPTPYGRREKTAGATSLCQPCWKRAIAGGVMHRHAARTRRLPPPRAPEVQRAPFVRQSWRIGA